MSMLGTTDMGMIQAAINTTQNTLNEQIGTKCNEDPWKYPER